MAQRPLNKNLPADLPKTWQESDIIPAYGPDLGLSVQYGYNYLGEQVNDAQSSINEINAEFDNLQSANSPALGYGICSTAADTAAKAVAVASGAATFTLFDGVSVRIIFMYTNTEANPTLNVNNTGALPIVSKTGTPIAAGAWDAGECHDFVYTGTAWQLVGVNGLRVRKVLKTDIITSSGDWVAPIFMVSPDVDVMLFGGGGGGSPTHAGCGGFMAHDVVQVERGKSYSVTIGLGGAGTSNLGETGGTTSFGTLLSAAGGASALGSSTAATTPLGGTGGGQVEGVGGDSSYAYYGCAGQYGGGSGAISSGQAASSNGNGGNGGTYGGGGGSAFGYGGTGGTGCGAGGTATLRQSTEVYNTTVVAAGAGTNTIGMGLEFEGQGLAGAADEKSATFDGLTYSRVAPGGGGGYGGNGSAGLLAYVTRYQYRQASYAAACGSGGGYGADGGSPFFLNHNVEIYSSYRLATGGGGGYGGKGGDAGEMQYGSYYYACAGGGGGYGIAKISTSPFGGYGYGAGGGTYYFRDSSQAPGSPNLNGADGIGILRYYVYEFSEV